MAQSVTISVYEHTGIIRIGGSAVSFAPGSGYTVPTGKRMVLKGHNKAVATDSHFISFQDDEYDHVMTYVLGGGTVFGFNTPLNAFMSGFLEDDV